MKKLLGILVLGLLLSGNAYAKIIELKKCSAGDKKFNPNHYEKRSYVINTGKSLVQRVFVLTDRYYEAQKKEFIKEFGDTEGLDKISIMNFKIEYSDSNYAKAVKQWDDHTGTTIYSSLAIDIKKKRIQYKMHQKSQGLTIQCK